MWEPHRAKLARMDWGVPIRWARDFPRWPDHLRRWLWEARAAGLTQIVVAEHPHVIELTALPPGAHWSDAA